MAEAYMDKDNKDILDLVKVGDWQLNEGAINYFQENKSGISSIGVVCFGNDKISMNIYESDGKLKLEYTHQSPLKEYESETAKEQLFNIKLDPDELYPAFYRRINSYGSKEFDINLIDKGVDELKISICKAFVEDGVLDLKNTLSYKAIRDNGTSFFKQVDKAIDGYIKNLCKKSKLDWDELHTLAHYYDNKVFDNNEHNRVGRINSVKRMLEDGLNPSQIVMIGSNMESVYNGDPRWAKRVLEEPEIIKIRQELAAKPSHSPAKVK